MFDPFGMNNHINSMLNGMLMDPFMTPQQRQQQMSRQQQQQQQMGGQSSNGNVGGASNNGGPSQLQLHRSNLFNADPFSMVSPFERHHQQHMQQHMSPFGGAGNPFALMHQMMPNMDNLFRNFENNHASNVIHADPSSQVFSSSSVISYSNGDGGKPKVFQQSKQMRQGPGGIKETREIVRDSEKGIEQMAIGHHIGDRAHIIEKKKTRDGNIEEVVNLENLDDEEVNEFNKEFEERIGAQYRSAHNHGHHHRTHHHLNNNHPLAIEDGSRPSKKEKDRKTKSKH